MSLTSSPKVSPSGEIVLSVKNLNAHLGCEICKGYYRNAQTITECLHTFCHECLMTEFSRQKDNLRGDKVCPICKISLGVTPKYMFDRTIQAIVDKIFPHFVEEIKVDSSSSSAKRTISVLTPENDATIEEASSSSNLTNKKIKSEQEIDGEVAIEAEGPPVLVRVLPHPHPPGGSDQLLPALSKPMLQATYSVKVNKVQKFIFKRLGEDLTASLKMGDIEILAHDTVLDPNLNLKYYFNRGDLIASTQADAVVLYYQRKL